MLENSELLAGLFNAHWTPLYERLTVGSMAAIQRARAMFSAPLARAMVSTELRSLAMMPGLIRMRLASSARVTSRTSWLRLSMAQWFRMASAKGAAGSITEEA